MGKSRGAQRTKGNTRPSSSGHSAQLLGSSGSLQFVGFSSSKVGQHVAQNSDNKVDGTFAMVMKKMLKRDATTKLKAVQEFRDLCVEKEKEQVLEVIAFWPRLYNKLALDFNRRIREATQEANGKLVSKVKRDLAPYLRNIMAVWLLSQNDLFPAAASAAQSAFVGVFPKEKQSEVLMFCKEEILSFCKDNLLEQTKESLSEPNTSEEEVDQKYILVICGTLQGLKQFIKTISSDASDTFVEDLKAIVSAGKFWKFAKHENSQIRFAWYSLISTLCHDLPGVFETLESKLGCTVLGRLSESDPVVAPAVWEAALYYVAGFENCWDNLNINKVVLPELFKLLKEGGRGNAHVLFPCLLPFLSKFPDDVIKRENFFPILFSHIIDSLFLESVKASPSECNAIVSAYIECLSYVCFQLSSKAEWCGVVRELISNQLVPLVGRSFTAEALHLQRSKFYSLLGSFIKTLENNTRKEDSFIKELFEDLEKSVWDQVYTMCEKLLTTENITQHSDLMFMAHFFHCMHKPVTFLDKKKAKVKFEDESLPSSPVSQPDSSTSMLCLPSQRSVFFSFIVKISRLLYRIVTTNLEPYYLKLFAAVLSTGCCPKLLKTILQEADVRLTEDAESSLEFFDKILVKWVQKADQEAVLETVADIVFTICSCFGKKSTLSILDSCCLVDRPEFLKHLLLRGMATYKEDGLFHVWLKSSQAGNSVLTLFKSTVGLSENNLKSKFHADSLQSYFSAFHNCLFHPTRKALLLDIKYYEEIISIIIDVMKTMHHKTRPWRSMDIEILGFVCCVAEKLFTYWDEFWMLPISYDFVKISLELYINHDQLPGSDHLENLKQKLCNLCSLGFRRLSTIQYNFDPDKQFIRKFSAFFHQLLTQPLSNKVPVRVFECFSVMIIEARNTYLNVEESEEADLKLLSLLEEIFPNDEQWDQIKSGSKLSLLPAFLRRKLFGPLLEEKIIVKEHKHDPLYSAVVENVSDIILKSMMSEELKEIKPTFIKLATKQLYYLLWAFSFYEQNKETKKEDPDLNQEEDDTCQLQKKCFKILSFLPKDTAVAFLHQLSEMSGCGSEWVLPFQNAIEMIMVQHSLDMSTIYKLYMLFSDEENSGKQLLSQMLIHYLPVPLKTDILLLYAPLFCESLKQKSVNSSAIAKICCCAQDNALMDNIEVHDALINVISEAITFINAEVMENDNDRKFALEWSSQVYCLMDQVLKNCPEVLVRLWGPSLDFVSASVQYCNSARKCIFTATEELIHAYHCSSMVSNLLWLTTGNGQFSERSISLRKPLFMSSVSQALISIFLDIANLSKTEQNFPHQITTFLAAVIGSFEFMPKQLIFDAVFSMVATNPEQCKEVDFHNILNEKLLTFLTSNVFPVQLGSHMILAQIMPMFPSFLSSSDSSQDSAEVKFQKIQPLVKLLEDTTGIVESMLSDFKISQNCYVQPGTDSYVYTLGFLFSWGAMLEYFSASTAQERCSYSSYLEANNLLSKFLSCLFRLLPENPLLCAPDKTNKTKDILKSVFQETPISERSTAAFVQQVACNLYYNALARMPAAVRSWGLTIDKKAYEVVHRFTSKYVSSLVAAREIKSLNENEERLMEMTAKNMTIQASPSTREVLAMYTIDSTTIELMIQLPADFPFGPITIEKRGNVKLGQAKWRQWMMQLTAFLTYQNGSILDGLLLWKKNLDKTFEGLEECLICFFILHSSSLELPQKSCPTCKKKFHASCIHKWFVTSNNATCPMCRNYW